MFKDLWFSKQKQKKAYDALCRYPNTFEHPSQAQRLEGIGQIMAKRLTEKMIEYCQNNDLPVPLPVKGWLI